MCVNQTATSGVQVLCGLRQSMPSSNIESCARVRQTVPSVACGQMKRPLSKRFAKRHRPSPSHHKSFTMSPLRPRKTKNVSGERLLLKHRLHLRAQAIQTTTHVGHPGGEPYLRSSTKIDHLRKLSRIDRNNAGSAPLSTLITALPGISM